MTLGQRLKTYREKEGLTQEQFAEYLNVSRQAVTKWEHDAGMPDIENLVAISRRMSVTLDELVLGQTAEEHAASSFPAGPYVPAVPESPAAPQRSAGSESKKSAPSAPLDRPIPFGPERGVPSELARYHAFAALAFVFAAFCQVVAGCVNLAAALRRSVPVYLPMLNFFSVMLLLYVAYMQAVKCSQYRQKSTYDPYEKE
ncbi:MAG: helix-turn-helix transcriptional regulator [Subdoligranulum sp.]|nr:helix-turn-helix transcriptional regulator [Subdoligranulum sp.]